MTELTWAEIKTFQTRIDETAITLQARLEASVDGETSMLAGHHAAETYRALEAVSTALSQYKSARSKAMHAARKAK